MKNPGTPYRLEMRADSLSSKKTTFSSARGTFSRIDHILVHKSHLSKFKNIEIISISSRTTLLRLDIPKKKKNLRNTNTWRLNNMFLNNQQVTEEIKTEIFFKIQKQTTVKTQKLKTYKMQQKQFQEGSSQQYNPTSRNKKKH